jgi:exodeoxyribonuclease-3
MKIVSWNVNGLRARWSEVSGLADELEPDILCLQEIKASPAQVPEPLTGLPAYHSHWHGGDGGYSGVSLHARRDRFGGRFAVSSPPFDMEHRITCADLGSLVVASVYVPNGNKDYNAKVGFLEAFAGWATEHRGRPLAICGDLNVALTAADVCERQRNSDSIGQRPRERELLDAAIAGGELTDAIRARWPDDDDRFTWWPPWRDEKARNQGWRIDFVLLGGGLGDRVERVDILRTRGSSDHAPVVVELAD